MKIITGLLLKYSRQVIHLPTSNVLYFRKTKKAFRASLNESLRFSSSHIHAKWFDNGKPLEYHSSKVLAGDEPFRGDTIEDKQFGRLRSAGLLRKRFENLPEETDDKDSIEYVDGLEGKRKRTALEYAKMIKLLLNDKKLVEALEVLEIQMKQDKAKPDEFVYRLLISGCSEVGYTKKAFQLFNEMKKRGLKVRGGVYTSLFDACSRSPWPADGLKRASRLWDLMVEQRLEFNHKIFHAAIKAFGRCGDIERAFGIVDEMTAQGISITSDTMNFLLHACVSDRTAGFRHSLMVWRKVVDKKLIPSIYTYNLFLRCARDCSVGDLKQFQKDLPLLLPQSSKMLSSSTDALTVFSSGETAGSPVIESSEPDNLPESMNFSSHRSVEISPEKSFKPWHRLMLLGGREGLLNSMKRTGVKPDIKTFTLLLYSIAPDINEEQILLEDMNRFGIKLDLDFCNMLMKKRNMRSQYQDARDVVSIIREKQLVPNIVTFGVLAQGCTDMKLIKSLLRDLKAQGFSVNVQILGTLLMQACRNWNFKIIDFIVKLLVKNNIKPNMLFVQHLLNFQQLVTKNIDAKQTGKGSYHAALDSEKFQNEIEDFNQLVIYVQSLDVEDAANVHPWNQFSRRSTSQVID